MYIEYYYFKLMPKWEFTYLSDTDFIGILKNTDLKLDIVSFEDQPNFTMITCNHNPFSENVILHEYFMKKLFEKLNCEKQMFDLYDCFAISANMDIYNILQLIPEIKYIKNKDTVKRLLL